MGLQEANTIYSSAHSFEYIMQTKNNYPTFLQVRICLAKSSLPSSSFSTEGVKDLLTAQCSGSSTSTHFKLMKLSVFEYDHMTKGDGRLEADYHARSLCLCQTILYYIIVSVVVESLTFENHWAIDFILRTVVIRQNVWMELQVVHKVATLPFLFLLVKA